MNLPPEDRLAGTNRLRAELFEQPADQAAVMPFVGLDFPDALALPRVAYAVPLPAIGEAGGELA
jgi:hypothetical protein